MDTNSPIFMKVPMVAKILAEVADSVPDGARLYLHGGALRNALYYKFFNQQFPQRDFDLILLGDKEPFVNTLLARGFLFGKKNEENAVVLKKARADNPTEDYADWLYLDIVIRDHTTIEEILEKKVNFTFNGHALDLKYLQSADWYGEVISLPGAQEDLKRKQIRVNRRYPNNIYACVRFVSRGFRPPSEQDLAEMMEDLRTITNEKFEYNRRKVIEYVGSEEKVLEIARGVGLKINILDLEEIRK